MIPLAEHDLARIRQAWERYKSASAAVGSGGNIYLEGRKLDAHREIDSILAELSGKRNGCETERKA